MKETISPNDAGSESPGEIRSRALRDGRMYLALRVRGIPSRCPGSRLNAMMTEPGLIARLSESPDSPLSLSEWKIERRELSESEWVFLGPDFRGASLSEIISVVRTEEESRKALSALEMLARTLLAVKDKGDALPVFCASSVIISEGGEILFLPGVLSRGCIDHSRVPRSAFEKSDADFNRPAAQFIAAAIREILIRSDGSRSDARADALPLSRIAPRLHPAILMAEESHRKRGSAYPLEKWAKALGEAAPAGFFSAADPEKAADERSMKSKALDRAGRMQGLKTGLKRLRPLFITLASLALLTAIVLPPILNSRTASRRFLAYSPERVVQTYYDAYSALNDQDMELCGKKNAIGGDVNLAINLSLTLKVRLSYEGRDPFIRAEKWLGAGRPAIHRDDYLFGLTELRIEANPVTGAIPANDASPSFRVSYTLWNTSPRELGNALYTRSSVTDDLLLEKTSLGWKIASLTRKEGDAEAQPVSYAD